MAKQGQNTAQKLSAEYLDLNGTHVEILNGPPTALEFSRLLHISRPVVIRNSGLNVGGDWTDEYLRDMMGDRPFSVAVTPNGRADAITKGPDDREYFVEPLVETMTMAQFLDGLAHSRSASGAEVYYLQSQNGNLYPGDSEFEPLQMHIPTNVEWCTEALGRPPDAVNLWIGDGRSVTSIHSDPYENIYTVLRGAKYFTLLPPTDAWALQERTYPHAFYTRSGSGSLMLTPTSCTPGEQRTVRWSSIVDPTNSTEFPPSVKPLTIALDPGDVLYLPAGWWHYVQQSEKSTTIAINWWYDMEMRGAHWIWLAFLRNIGTTQPPVKDEEREEAG